jgi:hypothetical protein
VIADPRLLRRALHSLRSRRKAILVVVIRPVGAVGTGLLARINVFQVKVLDHGIASGKLGLRSCGKDLLQKMQVLQLSLVGEFDVELDIQVPVIVVSKRRHSLAFDDFDGTCITSVCMIYKDNQGTSGETHQE